MAAKKVEPGPAKVPDRGPLVPRSVVTIVTLVLVGTIVYSSTRQDFRSMIVCGFVLLFILGADLGAILRGWRGGGQ